MVAQADRVNARTTRRAHVIYWCLKPVNPPFPGTFLSCSSFLDSLPG